MKNGLQHKPNQCARLLKHLQENGSITQRQAIIEYGIGQPAARIFELRKAGYKIKTTLVDGVNRYNEKTQYAVYTLEEEQGAQ